jgi:hypothetical protein
VGNRKEDRERLRASREIGRAYRNVESIRRLYLVAAVMLGLLGVVVVTANLWAGVVLGVGMVLLIFASEDVRVRPGRGSLWIAVLITAFVGHMVWSADHPTVLAIWGVAIAIALWCVVPLAFRVQRLMKQHPDLYITQKWQGRRGAAPETECGRRVAAETRRQAAQGRRRLLILGGSFVLFIAAVVVVKQQSAPPGPGPAPTRPPFASRAENFRLAWNNGGLDAVAMFLAPDERSSRRRRIERLMKKRDWHLRRPRLGEPTVEDIGRVKVTYPIEGLPDDVVFTVYFAWDADGWWWDKTRWPKTDRVR